MDYILVIIYDPLYHRTKYVGDNKIYRFIRYDNRMSIDFRTDS
jgi:hypothetical protein